MTPVPAPSNEARFPNLSSLLHYRFADLPADLRAGLSVAAVALPVGVAYAQLAGFPPVVGLYASILPPMAYAIFGSSRQMIVGPDAATCALLAAILAPLAVAGSPAYLALSALLTLLAGGFCLLGSRLRLGELADFLSLPILIGFLHGVALSILVSQTASMLVIPLAPGTIVEQFLQLLPPLLRGEGHGLSLLVGMLCLACLLLLHHWLPRLPSALLVMVAAALAVSALGLEARGVSTLGEVPAGLPWPGSALWHVDWTVLPHLVLPAAGVALISFASAILTARSFASKRSYDIDSEREFAAIGYANMAAALGNSFAISGTDSRTAVSDMAGGRTPLVSIVSALVMAVVLLFLTGPLRYVPVAALAAILVQAGLSMIDIKGMRELWRVSHMAVVLSLVTTAGVAAFGMIDGIGLAIGLSLLRFIRVMARPSDALLGRDPRLPGYFDLRLHPDARALPGGLIYRFNAPLVFFNAPYFRHRVLRQCETAGPDVRWIVIDMLPMTQVDATGLRTLEQLMAELDRRGIRMALAGRLGDLQVWFGASGAMSEAEAQARLYPTLKRAIKVLQAASRQAEAPAGPADQAGPALVVDEQPRPDQPASAAPDQRG
ncbi:STAS domain-containing protein [Laribacter hongkongensis]|uniref:SulP family inorganic anion transporter n=1 Tax=Laribacter hongkongensis TaxID=168471 RepID=UPI001EFC59EF|nr:SulP family inorganic anion transporter [Laribacter hongkongensis]MCG8992978.1 STAS domain-containing protein [Laribacter hongkongensis]MCG8999605.1 STAS domain-containing protein [Laribacter hongkongensis]MCG9001937.1 STAS domain-containing protein [Laribacter hongkongensis]MCG9005075.1 STAS domain-containing protein [Laribacter hongkongensis]MCG9008642.1 STAS domain-containing protein [Laribacter hongkongensis]